VHDRGPLGGHPLHRDALRCRTTLRHRVGHVTTIPGAPVGGTGTKATVFRRGPGVD
jgi:hypothetical protein